MNAGRPHAEAGKRLLLFLDYDGTLVPIRKIPHKAVLTPSRKSILARLSEKAFVCIVTGRSAADIRGLVPLDNIGFIGNHGLELVLGRRSWTHPQAKARRDALKALLSRIEKRTVRFPRIQVENKGVTGSIHLRRTDPALYPIVRKIVAESVAKSRRAFLLTEGKKVFEIRPNVDWNKGRGVLKMSRWISDGGSRMMFIGDDRTDEDVFRALARDAVTIHVGRGRDSAARHRLADVDTVWRTLRRLERGLSLEDGGQEESRRIRSRRR